MAQHMDRNSWRDLRLPTRGASFQTLVLAIRVLAAEGCEVIAPPEHIRALQTLYGNFFISTNEFVQWAGVAALHEAGEDSRRFRAIFDDRRKAMLAGLRSLGFGVGAEPTGAFYVLANARHLSTDSVSLAREILESSHVAVTPGAAFGANAEGYLRFSYASSLERIHEGLERLRRFLGGHRRRG